ncbi:hypothetical protein [Neotabrizicola sp. VNH66]|uniref:hypothetical protein n=1 Tax=Neotabrizicola sp. VNH66 TaxID=3400918 RepID=UPI003C03FDD8
MIRLAAALFLALVAAPALAEDASPIAVWGEDSGTLPPEYAWSYTVTFTTDRRVTVEYCKGYADTAPGCATVKKRLTKASFAAFQAELAPLALGLLEDPARTDPDPPIGGGAFFGKLNVDGEDVALPAFPVDEDKPQVDAILQVLQDYTPAGQVAAAEKQSKAP